MKSLNLSTAFYLNRISKLRMSIPAANMGLAKAGRQWLIEMLCFYFTLVLGDSLVLLTASLHQAPKR